MNLVPCKECGVEFDYIPGFAGNAPQFCDDCQSKKFSEDIENEKERTILEGNKYLATDKDYKNRYDPVDILVDGNMPDLPDEGEKFACATEIGLFIRKNGFMECESNVIKLFEHLGLPHWITCMRQWNLDQHEHAVQCGHFAKYVKMSMQLAV